MKKKFMVDCTMIYNGYTEVEAETKDEALEIASNDLSGEFGDDFPHEGYFGKTRFVFGEATADYVEEI